MLVNDQWVIQVRQALEAFLERNIDSGTNYAVWGALKAFFRGEVIAFQAELRKWEKCKIQQLQSALNQATGDSI